MINLNEVVETNMMIEKENLDVRTITLGISLLDCMSESVDTLCRKIYDKIAYTARDLVRTGNEIERDYAIKVVNKRISVTPIGIVGASSCRSAIMSVSPRPLTAWPGRWALISSEASPRFP